MKSILLAVVLVMGATTAFAGDNVANIFNNQTATTVISFHVGDKGKASVCVPFTNNSTAYDINVSADGGKHYFGFETYSGSTGGGIFDIPTNAPTDVQVNFRQKKKVHPYHPASATINTR